MKQEGWVGQPGPDGVAKHLFFGFVPAAPRAQALGFEAQERPRGQTDVVARGLGGAHPGLCHPAALLEPAVVLLDAPTQGRQRPALGFLSANSCPELKTSHHLRNSY